MSQEQARKLIVTADDFGAALSVNDAVEQAHRHGILTAASLMVTGDAASDAVARARTMPGLGVGLHLVLVEGRPALPLEQVPALVDDTGRFRRDMVRAGFAIFSSPAARRQLAAEVEAQFALFAATGLPLDHVNAHKHFHLHPTILSTVLRVGAGYGMRSLRAPVEPGRPIAAVDPLSVTRLSVARIDPTKLWAKLVRRRARAAGLLVPDQVFGLAWSGAFDAVRLRGLLHHLPPGISEIYVHPATDDCYIGHAPGYRYRDELAALIDPVVAHLAAVTNRGRFADFASDAAR